MDEYEKKLQLEKIDKKRLDEINNKHKLDEENKILNDNKHQRIEKYQLKRNFLKNSKPILISLKSNINKSNKETYDIENVNNDIKNVNNDIKNVNNDISIENNDIENINNEIKTDNKNEIDIKTNDIEIETNNIDIETNDIENIHPKKMCQNIYKNTFLNRKR